MSHHTEGFPPYCSLTQAIFGGRLVYSYFLSKLVDGTPVDLADALKGGHGALGYGCSLLPGAADVQMNAVDDSFLAAMSDVDLAAKLESVLPVDAEVVAANPLVWFEIMALVLELIRRLRSR